MNLSDGSRVLLCCFLAIVKDTFGQMKPSNAVAEVGGQAIFNCSGSSFLPYWFMSKDGSTANQLPIAGSCNVDINLQNHYKTEQTGGATTCNLIVFDVTMEQAGAYWCSEIGPYYALLTVIGKSPVTTNNATNGVVEESQNVIITCTLQHNGSVTPAPTLRPHFYWTNSIGQNESASYDSSTESTAISQITVTAGRTNTITYTCHVYLLLIPPTTPEYATNTPAVSNNATTPINVLYGPADITISRVYTNLTKCEVVCGVNELTCHVSANPLPAYEWFDVTNNVDIRLVSDNQKFTLAEDNRTYNCTAYNYIRGDKHVESSKYFVTSSPNSTPCKFPHNSAIEITTDGAFCEGQICHCTEEKPVNLTCFVDAYPAPSYQWNTDDKVLIEGASYVAVYNGIYICIATSDVAIAATKSITLIDCKTLPETETTGNPDFGSCTEVPPEEALINIAAIVLGVLLAVSLMGNLAAALYIVLRKSNDNAKAYWKSSVKTKTVDDVPSRNDVTNLDIEDTNTAAYEELSPVTSQEQLSAYATLAVDAPVCDDK